MRIRRFKSREVRIKRREERNIFRRNLLPMAWAVSLLGWIALMVMSISFLINGTWPRQFNALSWGLVLLPVVLTILGWMRGHYNPELEEP
ncbi:MAG: hypothetical protein WCI38_07030 [Chthoniobacterales bacterium]|jgi:hypothetical protein